MCECIAYERNCAAAAASVCPILLVMLGKILMVCVCVVAGWLAFLFILIPKAPVCFGVRDVDDSKNILMAEVRLEGTMHTYIFNMVKEYFSWFFVR